MGPSIKLALPFHRKRRAESPPGDSSGPVQKAPRMHLSSSSGHHEPPPSSANKLPPEIWMHILESIDHSSHIARPAYVNCFVEAIISDRATEAAIVPELPAFEKEAWRATRPYYAINATSRQAAHQSFLSGVLLQTCTPPLNQVPLKRNRGRREPRVPRTSIPPPFYPSMPLAKMRPMLTATGVPEPTYMPLELFDYRLFQNALRPGYERKTSAVAQERFAFMIKLYDEHNERLALAEADVTLLRTVRRVDLLAAAPYEHLMKPAHEFADMLGRAILRVWGELGVQGGVIRVLH